MTIARSQIIQLSATLFYHCVSRCVRQAFLCGVDQASSASFEHRRLWIIERIRLLCSAYTIEVASYAIMSNHYHLILHVNKAAAEALSDREVAERWQILFKGSKVVDRYLAGDNSVAELAQATLTKWRARLFDISWFMRSLNEYIAHKANDEDNRSGRFWEGRFKSQPLLDEKALLAAMAYVDLNPIRAAICKNVPKSEYTSAYERIHGKACKDDSGAATKPLMSFIGDEDSESHSLIPCTRLQYFDLLDWSSRLLVEGKRGFVGPNEPALLRQLAFAQDQWQTLCENLELLGLGALGTPEHVAHFHHIRGIKRIPCPPEITKLFA